MHGFASGLGLWCKNVDSLAAFRKVYAMDVLGFGRSSRPVFPKDATAAENLFVDSIETWRNALGLNKFILVAHSFGGYLSLAYAIRYPERIAHLVLVDPWGILEAPYDEESLLQNAQRPWLVKAVSDVMKNTNPLSVLRAFGPLGRNLIHFVRQDLRAVFDQQDLVVNQKPETDLEDSVPNGNSDTSDAPLDRGHPALREKIKRIEIRSHKTINLGDYDGTVALDYVYHINVQKPSGEVGFKSLCTKMWWVKLPMINRLDDLDTSIPITFIFGSRSWIDISAGEKTRVLRTSSYVDIKVIDGAGHQVHAQAADEFNEYVNAVCHRVDQHYPFKAIEPFTDNFSAGHSRCDSLSTRRFRSNISSSRVQSIFVTPGAEHVALPKRSKLAPPRTEHDDESSD